MYFIHTHKKEVTEEINDSNIFFLEEGRLWTLKYAHATLDTIILYNKTNQI